jgi:hypothetical protein
MATITIGMLCETPDGEATRAYVNSESGAEVVLTGTIDQAQRELPEGDWVAV